MLVCPRCHEPPRRELDRFVCDRCDVAAPVEDEIADFSGGLYYDTFTGPESLSAEHLRGLANESEAARISDYYLPLLRGLGARLGRPPRVLDSGCGNGEAVDVLGDAGFEAWGNDVSRLRRSQWSSRRRKDRLVVAPGESLPFADGAFDAVIASGVLEHVGVAELGGERYSVRPLPDRDARREAFLKSLLRVVASDGILFLDFPNGAFPIDFWHGTRAGAARFHSLREGFLPTVREVARLCRSVDPSLRVTALSPRRRLRFRQVGAHWYGRAFRPALQLLHLLMSTPGLRFLAASPLNPYLVLRVTRRPTPYWRAALGRQRDAGRRRRERLRFAVMYAFGRLVAVRRLAARRESRPEEAGAGVTAFAGAPAADVAAALSRDGVDARLRLDRAVARRYAPSDFVTVFGPAGTVVVEDPFAIHRALAPRRRPRLAFQLAFAAHDHGAAPFAP